MPAHIVEVFWDARFLVTGKAVRFGSKAPPPELITLLDGVRIAVAEAFPDRPTLFRIKTRGREPAQVLRVVQDGRELSGEALHAVDARITNAVARAAPQGA